jgi:hypothetical protein
MTAPAVYAEGLRVLWLLFSRGVSATWDGTAVMIAPPDSTADGALEELEAVLRPDADGCSYLQRARARHAPFLREVNDAKPADATNRQWRDAIEGLESFLLSGWGDEALRLGWPKNELYAVPPVWARVDLCGAGLLIGDREVTGVTSSSIQIKTASGATQSFYRKPAVDYGLVYRERLKLHGGDANKEEPQLRAVEYVVNFYRSQHHCSLEDAKAAVLAAIKRSAAP